jgi:hypothetical protein
MDARSVARLYGAGRVALGAGLLIAPRPLGRVWLGRAGGSPAGSVALRALGAREVVLGGISLHTLDRPEVAARWQGACAVVDAVDLVATAAVRPQLPRVGSALVMAMAGAGAAVGAALAHALGREA